MGYSYLTEAFKKLNLLEDDFNISDAGKVDELQTFMADDIEEPIEVPVIDTEAADESELQDTYVGKIILECNCCHSRLYKNPEDVVASEDEDLVNEDEECPVCNTASGFTVIGKITEFKPEDHEEEDNDEVEEHDEDESEEISDDDIAEALRESIRDRRCHESDESEEDCLRQKRLAKFKKSHRHEFDGLDEELDSVEVATKDGNVSIKRDGAKLKINLDDESAADVESDDLDLGLDDYSDDLDVDSDDLDLEPAGDEMIAPLTDEESDELLAPEEEEPAEDEESAEESEESETEEPAEEPEEAPEDLDAEEENEEEDEDSYGEALEFDSFNEKNFNELCEAFLNEAYSNVKSFTTMNCVELTEDKMEVRGRISFNNGKSKNTVFTLSNPRMFHNKVLMEGLNPLFSDRHAFRVSGHLNKGEFIPESMRYNFMAKNLNESAQTPVRVSGFVKIK